MITQEENYTLHHADCLDALRTIEAESVDAIITDPPYGIDYQSARRIDKADWKPKIANDKLPFIWWLYDAYRVLKWGGALLCFCRWDVQDVFKMAIECAGFEIKSQVIWDREVHGMGDLRGAFSPQHDVVWFASKGRFNFPGKRPASIIRSQRLSGNQLTHPNEKPLDLLAQLIGSTTHPGEVVLDCFLGSGVTGEAAIRSGRKFVGIEKSPEYFDLSRRRIENARREPPLLLAPCCEPPASAMAQYSLLEPCGPLPQEEVHVS